MSDRDENLRLAEAKAMYGYTCPKCGNRDLEANSATTFSELTFLCLPCEYQFDPANFLDT